MKDLAPTVYRQRLVIEGLSKFSITDQIIEDYLGQLSEKISMKTLTKPVTHKSVHYGWAGWIHWETSGAHFYAWDKPEFFFSCDIYTCKSFNVKKAVEFTEKFFDSCEIVYKEF